MAKKKKKADAPKPGQPRFASLKIVVIGAAKPQRASVGDEGRDRVLRRIAKGPVHARGAGSSYRCDARVTCVGPDPPLAFRVHQDCPRASLVHEAWLASSLANGAQGPLASIQDHEWAVPDSQELACSVETPMSQDEEQRFCVLLMVDRGDSDAVEYRRIVGDACAVEVREACRFPEEHLHITLAEGRCTGREASQIRLRSSVPALSRIQYGPPKPWDRCLALGLDDATPLYDLACDLEMPSTVKLKNSKQYHVSLYRANGRGDDLAQETGKMKAAGREFGGHGSCRARSVVVKVVAAPYESARVVADIPSRQLHCATCASPLLETCPIPYETRSPTPALPLLTRSRKRRSLCAAHLRRTAPWSSSGPRPSGRRPPRDDGC